MSRLSALKPLPAAFFLVLLLGWMCHGDDRTIVIGEVEAPMPGVPGKYYKAYVPQNYDPTRSCPLLIWLHGARGKPDVTRWKATASRESFIVLAPTCRGEGWYNQCGPNIMKAMAQVKSRYSIDDRCVVIGGASSGGAQTYQLLKEQPREFAAAVVLVMYRRYDIKPPRAGFPIRIEAGAKDEIAPIHKVRRTVARFKALGFDVTYVEHEDRGHNVAVDPDQIWDWVKEKTKMR